MKGYWNKPDATAAAIRDGWMRTGDAAYMDEDGYVFIYDRVKDMIGRAARTSIRPRSRTRFSAIPAIADAAVIGVPDDTWGEAVKAIVVLKPGAPQDAADIIAWARARIAHFKTPKSVDFVDAIPRNITGKILQARIARALLERARPQGQLKPGVDAGAAPRYARRLGQRRRLVRHARRGKSMVKLNVIYTRTGDKGETGLGDGSRRPKSDARVAAMGDVDETNCAIGLALLAVRECERRGRPRDRAGADANPERSVRSRRRPLPSAASRTKSRARFCASRRLKFRRSSTPSTRLNAKLHPLRSFVLPGGTAAAAALHQARAVCRRAERAMVALAAIEGEEVGEAALAYVNRLSDYLFVAARAANDFGRSDVLWAPGANQSESPDQTEDDER